MHHIKTTSDLRIIPAFAGNTFLPVLPNPPREDHPRFRGEHILSHSLIRSVIGSSPLSRGTLGKSFRRSSLSRIIPAFAGNTCLSSARDRRSADHPRFRGEHQFVIFFTQKGTGSSPLSRGTHTRNGDYALQPRIIPAFAGNTHPQRRLCAPAEDHPRFRGEHLCMFPNMPHTAGSSPLSRGTPKKRGPKPSNQRIIPAFAGNTWEETSF